VNTEHRSAKTVEVFADPGHPRENLKRLRVHVGTLGRPGSNNPIHIIKAFWHHPIIGVWQTRGAFHALRLGVTAARQPLEL
jgi:hypothetical protein